MVENASPPLHLSVVVPVYRSAEILPRLAEEVDKALRNANLGGRFELLLVCDASPDNSWAVIETLATQHPFVRGICLRKNAGQHNATMAGLNHARGEMVVIIDDDLQHPPNDIGMLAELEKGFDVCYTRYQNRKHALWKKAGSWGNDFIASFVLSKPRGLYLSSFKAMRGDVAREVVKYDGPFAYVDGLILDVTRSITSIAIEHQDRLSGRGNYNFKRSMSLLLKMATSFSILPLRIVSMLGIILAGLSLLVVIVAVILKLHNPSIQAGWASLIAAVFFVGSVQMLGMGMIGEYLGRAYLKINRKPQFVIRKTTWKD